MTKRPLSSSAGFTYIAALVMIVVIGILAAQAATVWSTRMQRERETELIYKGTQVRNGMRRLYGMTLKPYGNLPLPGVPQPVPPPVVTPNNARLNELKDLLQAPESAGKKHYIRASDLKVKDPATGKDVDWELFKAPGGKVTGVFIKSEGQPIKQDNFPFELFTDDFKDKKKYSDWVFICDHYAKLPGTPGGVTGLEGTKAPGGTGGSAGGSGGSTGGAGSSTGGTGSNNPPGSTTGKTTP